jgi:hypothetical protein
MFVFLAASAVFADEPSGETREARLRQQVGQLLETAEGSDWIPLIMADLELSTDLTPESQDCCRRILRRWQRQMMRRRSSMCTRCLKMSRSAGGWPLRLSRWPQQSRPGSLRNWRLLVRSLNVVRHGEAVAVLHALQRYRQRANKGHWVRRVILTGLRLAETDRQAACDLLQHWTGQPERPAAAWTLSEYQQWFAAEHQDLPPAVLPEDPAGAVWTGAVA